VYDIVYKRETIISQTFGRKHNVLEKEHTTEYPGNHAGSGRGTAEIDENLPKKRDK
jgi:hypothetical protein